MAQNEETDREENIRHTKETQRIQLGFEIDGLPGKERIQVRECAGLCGYYVQPTDKYCLNCGLIDPYQERPRKPLRREELTWLKNVYKAGKIALIVGIIFVIVGEIFIGPGNLTTFLIPALLVFLFLVIPDAIYEIEYRNINATIDRLNNKNSDCFINKAINLLDALDSNNGEVKRLEKMIQDSLSLKNSERSTLALSTLKEVLQVQLCKGLQYEAILWELGKARLANTGFIALSDTSNSSATRREEYAHHLSEHMEKGYALVRKWQHNEDRRIQDILIRLQESLSICEEVRSELLARHAQILASRATNFDKSLLESTHINTDATESFYAIGTATETFYAGFGELEKEYYRLLGEKEVIQELGNVQ